VRISIASGKGGTGKTSLALLLASERPGITVIDSDVEEPNCHLFLKTEQKQEKVVTIMVPGIDNEKCSGCEVCAEACFFNAIAVVGGKAMVFDELCHSCGGCLLKCPQGAISEAEKPIGIVSSGYSTTVAGTRLMSGLLNIGVPSGVPLIKALLKEARTIEGEVIVDCPPGTSCSMVSAVKDSDYCLLVTEPTPFGRHDLALAINITQLLNLRTGVVINKNDGGDGDEAIEELCHSRGISVVAKIPYSHSFAREYSNGKISLENRTIAEDIWRQIQCVGRERKA